MIQILSYIQNDLFLARRRFAVRHFQSRLLAILLMTLITGCAGLRNAPVHVGDTEAQVLAAKGAPTNRYEIDSGHLLEYRHGPWGQETYMARFDHAGKLVSYEQVLTDAKFASIKLNQFDKTQVLHTIGAPSATSYLALSRLEVWSYPYKESGVWNSVMHVHFDQAGIVRQMLNMPDVRLSPERGFSDMASR